RMTRRDSAVARISLKALGRRAIDRHGPARARRSRMNTTRSAIAAVLALAVSLSPALPGLPRGGDPGRAAAATPIIHLQSVLTGLSSPVFVSSGRDGSNRLFVLERAGVIKVV